jgi:hypothetical protein
MAVLTAPSFSTRMPCQWLSADNPSLNITAANSNLLQNNPSTLKIDSGVVPKIEMGLNGQTLFRGDGEYSPFALTCQWKQLSYTDYQKLAALRPYFVTMITFRNLGYYGKMFMDGGQSDAPKVYDVPATTGTFYALSPSDAGGASTVNRLPVPAGTGLSRKNNGNGFIANGTVLYYWVTFSSIWGETTPTYVGTITATADNSQVQVSWSWPTSSYVQYASVYVNGINLDTDINTCKKLADVIYDNTSASAQWVDVVGVAGTSMAAIPPATNFAYRGQWQSGIWYNES